MGDIEVARLDGGRETIGDRELEFLATEVGPVLQAGDAGWDEAILIWNGMVARQPALVVQPSTAAGVAAAVRFAADRGLLLSVKGGGHNVAGTSLAAGGLTLELSRMRDVTVDVDARLANVGGGCLLRHVDAATQEHGLAAVLGFVSETGVAGLTLGGGFGYLTRRYGWTIDNLVEVEIVTADGQVRTASRDQHDDLFWALRGGGGNFGIATRFTFKLYEVGPMITGGLIAWSAEHADELLPMYRDFSAAAPRELTTALTWRLAPPAPFLPPEWHGKPIIGVVACHTGANAAADLAPLRSFGQPIADVIMEKPYAAQQAMLDATQPKGAHYYWKSEFVPGLSDGFLDAYRAGASAVTSPMSQSVLFHLEGALSEHDAHDGAMGNREAGFVCAFAGSWPAADDRAPAHTAWARQSWQGIRPFSVGNYVNFQVAEEDAGRTADAYGVNFERLRQVKAAYDPHNLFRVNRNIAPVA
ncbi:MAG TPA: FAD-binding oxidoreductase [Acidimicrobiales bacterium]|nr:FAD-binding oxidoreductase [Acidimicrobiales bacterium]